MLSARILIFLFYSYCFIVAEIGPRPKRWCHRELPVVNGTFKFEAPYWQYPGCPNQPFDVEATKNCMKGRTLYVMGNSVGRQAAFGLVEMLGGASVKRENQRDMCPKHETTWDDSCHQEFADVKIRYLFIQFMDGFNYTDRNGAPFWKQRVHNHIGVDGEVIPGSAWKVGRLANGRGNTPDEFEPGSFWADDNCIQHQTRECLARFFNGSTENDVFIFTLGMSYQLESLEEERRQEEAAKSDFLGFDKRSWLVASAANFRAHIAAVFKGTVFRVTLAQTNKDGTSRAMTPKLRETDTVLNKVWQTESTSPDKMWYQVDQWAINKGRDYLYNDHIHFNGPLTLATLHVMLNELCPGQGSSHLETPWPKPELRGTVLVPAVTPASTGRSEAVYFVDESGYAHLCHPAPTSEAVSSAGKVTLPWYLVGRPLLEVASEVIDAISKSPVEIPYMKPEFLLRGSNEKVVYWVKDGKRHPFPGIGVFASHGFDFSDVIVLDQWLLALIPEGESVTRRRRNLH